MGFNRGKVFSLCQITECSSSDTRYAWLYSKDNKGDGKQDEKAENKKKIYFTGIMQVFCIKSVSFLET
jgi:hypothetical protein